MGRCLGNISRAKLADVSVGHVGRSLNLEQKTDHQVINSVITIKLEGQGKQNVTAMWTIKETFKFDNEYDFNYKYSILV